jgi:predicted ABC-type ATPase
MIAGPNGSGKSTLVEKLQARGVSFGEYLNADAIARSLGGGDQANRHAQQLVREGRARALAERRDYAWETVMSHPSHIEHLREARSAGYEIYVIYVATEHPAVSALRVRERVGKGGHDVPVGKIYERYAGSLAKLPMALLASHFASVFDNSDPDDPFRLICEVRENIMTLHLDYADMPAWFQPTLQYLHSRQNIDLG